MVSKSPQKYFYFLPSLWSRKVLAGGGHKSDFEMLECPGSSYTPAGTRVLHNGRCFLYPRLPATMTTIPQHPNASTSQPINKASLTTSSPLKQIRPGLGAVATKHSFQDKHTRCHIFPHRMCLHFRFSEALLPVVIFHDNRDSSLSSVFLLPAERGKNVFYL